MIVGARVYGGGRRGKVEGGGRCGHGRASPELHGLGDGALVRPYHAATGRWPVVEVGGGGARRKRRRMCGGGPSAGKKKQARRRWCSYASIRPDVRTIAPLLELIFHDENGASKVPVILHMAVQKRMSDRTRGGHKKYYYSQSIC